MTRKFIPTLTEGGRKSGAANRQWRNRHFGSGLFSEGCG